MTFHGHACLVCIKAPDLPLSVYTVYCDDEHFAKLAAIEAYQAENLFDIEHDKDIQVLNHVMLDTALFHAYRNKVDTHEHHPFITVAMIDNIDAQIHCIFARDDAHASLETINMLNDSIPQLIEGGLASVPYACSLHDVLKNAFAIPLVTEYNPGMGLDDDGMWGDEDISVEEIGRAHV